MNFKLATTPSFEKRLKKFVTRHPELKADIAELFRGLEANPFQPRLKLHPLKGKLKGILAASLSHSYRVTLTIAVSEKEILLLDIGSHDEVYRAL